MIMAKWWKYLINPAGAIVQDLTRKSKDGSLGAAISGILNPGDTLVQALSGDKYHDIGDITNEGIRNAYEWITTGEGGQGISNAWDDLTGKSQIREQNEANRELAEEEYQRNLQAIGDTAAAYQAAGFNRNLMYSSNGVQYSAPDLQAYSGSKKLDTIMSNVGKVLSMIPAMYQATAALEGIDQAREKTKQTEIKTMADGLRLLDLGYNVGEKRFSLPFSPNLFPYRFGSKRHVKDIDYSSIGLMPMNDSFYRYADAALKNKFDLLESIGISNSLRSTRNSYLGYQYDLDRRFGAAGRIVGIGSQGLRAIGGLFSPIKLGGFK